MGLHFLLLSGNENRSGRTCGECVVWYQRIASVGCQRHEEHAQLTERAHVSNMQHGRSLCRRDVIECVLVQ